MKHNTNELMFDGSFIFNGETVYYRIVDDNKPIRTVDGEEKFSRYINFFNNTYKHIGVKQVYGSFDDLTNISPCNAEEWYTQLKNNC